MSNENSAELELTRDESRNQTRWETSSKRNAIAPVRKMALAKEHLTVATDGIQYDGSQLAEVGKSFETSVYKTLAGSVRFGRGPGLPRSHATIDLLLILFGFFTVHLMYLGTLELSSQRTVVLLSSIVLFVLSLSVSGIYSKKRLLNLNEELSILLICWMCAFPAIGLFTFLTKTAEDVSRVWITASVLLSLALLTGLRVISCFGFVARNRVRARNVIVCGNAQSIQPVMRSLSDFSSSRFRVAKVFDFSTHRSQEAERCSALQDSANQIVRFVEHQRQTGDAVEQVWIALPAHQSHIIDTLSKALKNSPVDVCVVPDSYTERLLTGEVTRVGSTKTVNISEISLPPAADRFKRVFDVIFASTALLFLCIPMAVITLLIKTDSPGPALFRQKRYGVDGREIEILKFRSMRVHTDSQVKQATKNDVRVTRLGKLLRSTSLDELPQLINVLRGNMSLVGPRPHAVAHNETWRRQIEGYMLRHRARPGITGWAQVNGWRGETDTAFKMQQRVKYDLEYIQKWSPWLDIKIIFLTVVKGLRNENAY